MAPNRFFHKVTKIPTQFTTAHTEKHCHQKRWNHSDRDCLLLYFSDGTKTSEHWKRTQTKNQRENFENKTHFIRMERE